MFLPVSSSKDRDANPASDQTESPAATLSDRWQITILKTLKGLDLFKKYAIGTQAELPRSDYEMVGWDQFKVHSLDEKSSIQKNWDLV